MSPAVPVVHHRKGISAIWILPLLALGICSWLLYSSYRDAGILITISFEEANGVTPGKTQVMSRGIPIGLVQEVHPDLDNQQVRVVVKMEKESEGYLVEDSLFWVVRPELSAARIQGLDTIFSGSYIAIQTGSSTRSSREFTGLSTAPPVPRDAPGLHLSLQAETLGSIQAGTGIYYRNIEIGSVQGYHLQDDDSVLISLFIKNEYADIVREQSRFCNASGISVSGKLTNLKVQVESLAALLKGGILLYTPEQLKDSPAAQNGRTFKLYKDLEEANYGIPMTLNLVSAVDIVEGDTKIMYRGIEAGFVKEIQIDPDDRRTVTAHILLDPRAELILREQTTFWLVKPEISPSGVNNLRTLIVGPHITFKPGGGEFRDHFEILPAPPPDEPLRPGATFVLTANEAVSFSPQSPVFYKNIKVGEIISIDLDSTGKSVRTTIFIYEPYLHLIDGDSVFWQQSGVEAQADFSGVRIRTGPLAEMFTGSISFATPEKRSTSAKPIGKNLSFRIYSSYAEAVKKVPALQQPGLSISLRTSDPASLSVGSPLLFKGMEVGRITGFQLAANKREVFIDCFIERKHADLVGSATRFYNLSGIEVSGNLAGISMKTGSLQTIVSGGIGLLTSPGQDTGRKTTAYPLYKDLQDALHAEDMSIRVQFEKEVGQLKTGSPMTYKGVTIGTVTALNFTADLQTLVADIRIDRKFSPLFRKDTKIWLEQPQFSISGINNPETVLFGPYLTFLPGKGVPAREFTALNSPPQPFPGSGKDFTIILETARLGSLGPGSPVSYRQVQVGRVTGFTLSPTFQKVYVSVAIDPQYRNIIRENTRFWNSSGTRFSAGLFSGVQFESESLETVIRGGIALATPEDCGSLVETGRHYHLFDEAEPAWLEWRPNLAGSNNERKTAGKR